MGALGTLRQKTRMNFTLLLCLSPLVIIFVLMKFIVWISAVNAESDYVRREPLRKRGPFVENAYADVDAEEEEYGDRTDYR
jgi:hypothetical protein